MGDSKMENLNKLIKYSDDKFISNILLDDYSILEWFREYKLTTYESLMYYEYLHSRSIKVLNTGNNLKALYNYIKDLIKNNISTIHSADITNKLGKMTSLIDFDDLNDFLNLNNIAVIGILENGQEFTIKTDTTASSLKEKIVVNNRLDIQENNTVTNNDSQINQDFEDGEDIDSLSKSNLDELLNMSSKMSLEDLIKSSVFQNEINQVKMEITWKDNKEALAEIAKADNIFHESNIEIVESLVKANHGLVIKNVLRYKRFSTPSYTVDDMYQEGVLGLLKSIEKFDFSKETELSTYATWWIRQHITRGICDQSSTIRIPVHMVERIQKFNKFESEFFKTNNKFPTDFEIASYLGIELEKVAELYVYRQYSKLTSLDLPVGAEGDTNLGDLIEDPIIQQPEEILLKKQRHIEILNVLDKHLSEKEKDILKYRFGFFNDRQYTLESVGEIYGVTRERIRQIESKALRKLKFILRGDYDVFY